MSDFNTSTLARLRIVRKAEQRAYKVHKHLEDKRKGLEREVYQEFEDTEDLDAARHGGFTYTPYGQIRGYVEDRDAFEEWCRDNAPELIRPEPRKQLLNQEVRRRLDDGEPLPPGVKFVETPKISIRKS